MAVEVAEAGGHAGHGAPCAALVARICCQGRPGQDVHGLEAGFDPLLGDVDDGRLGFVEQLVGVLLLVIAPAWMILAEDRISRRRRAFSLMILA